MASDVNIRFVPKATPPAPSSAPKGYTVMEVNGVSFLVTDMVAGKAAAYTDAVWKSKVEDLKTLFGQLEADNAGDFNAESVHQVDVLSNRVTYSKRSNPQATPIVAKLTDTKILAKFSKTPHVPFTHAGLHATHRGAFSQYTSPKALETPAAKSACSYIVLEMVDRAFTQEVLCDTDMINDIVEVGQEKYLAKRLGRQHVNVAEIDLAADFRNIKLNPDISLAPEISQNDTVQFYKGLLNTLADLTQKKCGATLTNRGETVGLVFIRDDAFELTDILYFDSHGNVNNDADGKACIKHFKSIEAAGAFLAHRIPHQPVSHDPDWNLLSISSICKKS